MWERCGNLRNNFTYGIEYNWEDKAKYMTVHFGSSRCSYKPDEFWKNITNIYKAISL